MQRGYHRAQHSVACVGELCCVEGTPFDAGRDLTFDAIEFRLPCTESRGEPWLTIDIVPVKDTVARARICPMPIRQRAPEAPLRQTAECATTRSTTLCVRTTQWSGYGARD